MPLKEKYKTNYFPAQQQDGNSTITKKCNNMAMMLITWKQDTPI